MGIRLSFNQMKKLSNIFSVFLTFSVLVAVSYCCCIKEALAKETHSCCAQKSSSSSNPCHQKDQTCPKVVSLLSDQMFDVKPVGLPQLSLAQAIPYFFKSSVSVHPVYSASDKPLQKSSVVPLYITQHNFRI